MNVLLAYISLCADWDRFIVPAETSAEGDKRRARARERERDEENE